MAGRRYKGKKPRAEYWDQIGVVEDGERWFVFVSKSGDSEWLTAKVVLDGRIACKANYRLGWNGKRFAQQADAFAMMHRRPMLMGKVERLLEGYDLL
jgi:hypothetical protein